MSMFMAGLCTGLGFAVAVQFVMLWALRRKLRTQLGITTSQPGVTALPAGFRQGRPRQIGAGGNESNGCGG